MNDMNKAIKNRLEQKHEYSRAMAHRMFKKHLTKEEAYMEGMKDGYTKAVNETVQKIEGADHDNI